MFVISMGSKNIKAGQSWVLIFSLLLRPWARNFSEHICSVSDYKINLS